MKALIITTARSYWDAIERLRDDYGLPLAGAVSFATILALFPFLIFVTAMAGFVGGEEAAEGAVAELFETLPHEVASTLAPELRRVLGVQRGDLLTFGILLTLLFSASGVESMRTALNTAYRVTDRRSLWFRWAQSCLFVVAGALAMLLFGLAVVVLPLVRDEAQRLLPNLAPQVRIIADLGHVIGVVVLAAVLSAMHLWLPAGRRRLADIWPGVLNTLALWTLAGVAYSAYLSRFNYYTATYAGLANAMIALMFFYICAVIFVFGAELNRALIEDRARRQRSAEAEPGRKKRRATGAGASRTARRR